MSGGKHLFIGPRDDKTPGEIPDTGWIDLSDYILYLLCISI